MALWRSWLARRPVTAEVAGSSPVRVANTENPLQYVGGFFYAVMPHTGASHGVVPPIPLLTGAVPCA